MNTLNTHATIDNNTSERISNNKRIINIQIRIKIANSHNNSRSIDRVICIANTTCKTLIRIVRCSITIHIITKFCMNIYNFVITCCRK